MKEVDICSNGTELIHSKSYSTNHSSSKLHHRNMKTRFDTSGYVTRELKRVCSGHTFLNSKMKWADPIEWWWLVRVNSVKNDKKIESKLHLAAGNPEPNRLYASHLIHKKNFKKKIVASIKHLLMRCYAITLNLTILTFAIALNSVNKSFGD